MLRVVRVMSGWEVAALARARLPLPLVQLAEDLKCPIHRVSAPPYHDPRTRSPCFRSVWVLCQRARPRHRSRYRRHHRRYGSPSAKFKVSTASGDVGALGGKKPPTCSRSCMRSINTSSTSLFWLRSAWKSCRRICAFRPSDSCSSFVRTDRAYAMF